MHDDMSASNEARGDDLCQTGAMGVSDVVKAATDALVHFVQAAGLWFWLSVAAATALLLDRRGLVVLARAADPRTAVLLLLVVFIALWLNAAGVHNVAVRTFAGGVRAIGRAVAELKRRRRMRRVDPKAIRKLEKILLIDCLERRWFLWYVSQNPDPKLLWGALMHGTEFSGMRELV